MSNSILNSLNYDISISQRNKAEMDKGFITERVSDSPLQGRYGIPFHAVQPPTSWASPQWTHKIETNDPEPPIAEVPSESELEGLPGQEGPRGFRGDIGAIGNTIGGGSTGPDGKTGPRGHAGRGGIQGPKGATGIQGTYPWREEDERFGSTGPVGVTGPTGDTGPGPRGPRRTGPRGVRGSTGPDGIAIQEWPPDYCPGGCCISDSVESWIAFPEPTYPGEVGYRQTIVGESHAFMLYFISPTDGKKKVFYPYVDPAHTGSHPYKKVFTNNATYKTYTDPNNPDGSLINSQLIIPQFENYGITPYVSPQGSEDSSLGFLAKNVATEFTRAECDSFGAFRKGIGNWGNDNNEIDGYGVCGCNEVTTSFVDGEGILTTMTADELRVEAATEARGHANNPGNVNGPFGPWNMYWQNTWTPSQTDIYFATNSKGRFVVGEGRGWVGWDYPSEDNAKPINSRFKRPDGCLTVLFDGDPSSGDACKDNPQYRGYHFLTGRNLCDNNNDPSCLQFNPSNSGDSDYFNLDSNWGDATCHDYINSGVFNCDTRVTPFGPQYAVSDGDFESYEGTYVGMDPNTHGPCGLPSCCQSQCSEGNDTTGSFSSDDWSDQGLFQAVNNWDGIVSYHDDSRWHWQNNTSNYLYSTSDEGALQIPGGSTDLPKSTLEEYGYYKSHLLYHPPSSGKNGLDTVLNRVSGESYKYTPFIMMSTRGHLSVGEGQPRNFPTYVLGQKAGAGQWGNLPDKTGKREYEPTDILPTHAKLSHLPGTTSNYPLKPFPTLVMNGKAIAKALDDWRNCGTNGTHLPENLGPIGPDGNTIGTVDVRVMIFSAWDMFGMGNGDTSDSGHDESWTLKDPWPHLAPHLSEHSATFTDYDEDKGRASWHCRVGGQTSGNTVNWDECDFCLGTRIDGGVTTHEGKRFGVGPREYGVHGKQHPDLSLGTLSLWDSYDNGVDTYQTFHYLNGVYYGNNVAWEDPEDCGWGWDRHAMGPFQDSEDDAPNGFPTYNPPYDPSQISRMSDYINDYFEEDRFYYHVPMGRDPYDNAPRKNGWRDSVSYSQSNQDASYITITDYTVKRFCIQ